MIFQIFFGGGKVLWMPYFLAILLIPITFICKHFQGLFSNICIVD